MSVSSDPSALAAAAAIARLETQMAHMAECARKRDELLARLEQKIDNLETMLEQARGGFALLRWFGFGSLASAIAVGSAVYAWFTRAP